MPLSTEETVAMWVAAVAGIVAAAFVARCVFKHPSNFMFVIVVIKCAGDLLRAYAHFAELDFVAVATRDAHAHASARLFDFAVYLFPEHAARVCRAA